ncbi:MAG: Crp/Fnr family transcriptional regulator [Bryobacterales bacterium]|nr:Crp/Fnr family transcriptional regulator [Bryobacterales bacterium]
MKGSDSSDERLGWGFLAHLGSRKPQPRGAEILRQGTPSRDAILIERGLVAISMADEEGQQRIADVRRSGSALEVCAALLDAPCPFTAKALTDCSLWHVRAADLWRVMAEDRAVARRMQQSLCQEVLISIPRWAHGPRWSARRRFAELLIQLGRGASDLPKTPLQVHLPLKLWELAELLAITPAHLSRMLQGMRSEGVLERQPGYVFVLKRLLKPGEY